MALAVPRDRQSRWDFEPSPFVPWSEFRPWFASQWSQGEHVTLIGPTGSGKTELGIRLLTLRDAVVAFGVKARDTTLERLIYAGYMPLKEWNGDLADYVVLWPPIQGIGHLDRQRETFTKAIDAIHRSGGWCVFIDEVSYLSDLLKMDTQLKFLLQQGRSSGISVVACTQRPAFIPLAFYDQATHMFLWKNGDAQARKRLGEVAGDQAIAVTSEVGSLDKHEVLYYNKDTGHRIKTKVEV